MKERSQRRVIQDEAECSCVIILEQEGQWEDDNQIDPELLAKIYSELSKDVESPRARHAHATWTRTTVSQTRSQCRIAHANDEQQRPKL